MGSSLSLLLYMTMTHHYTKMQQLALLWKVKPYGVRRFQKCGGVALNVDQVMARISDKSSALLVFTRNLGPIWVPKVGPPLENHYLGQPMCPQQSVAA